MKVTVSTAVSADGYLDDRSPDRLILSTPEDWAEVHRLRAACDAILVGAETIRRDNPSLLVGDEVLRRERIDRGLSPDPVKVTLTASCRLSPEANFFTRGDQEKIVFMQQIICIDNTFHQNIRSTLTNNTYSLTRRLIGILYMHRTDVLGIFLQCRIFFKNRRVANHQELRNPFFQRTGNGVFRIGVISTNYCNTFPFVQGFQM